MIRSGNWLTQHIDRLPYKLAGGAHGSKRTCAPFTPEDLQAFLLELSLDRLDTIKFSLRFEKFSLRSIWIRNLLPFSDDTPAPLHHALIFPALKFVLTSVR